MGLEEHRVCLLGTHDANGKQRRSRLERHSDHATSREALEPIAFPEEFRRTAHALGKGNHAPARTEQPMDVL